MLNPTRWRGAPSVPMLMLVCTLLLSSCGTGDSGSSGGSTGGGGSSTSDPPITISPSTLPAGQAGHAYSVTLSATGGTAPFSWAVANGTLPAGLTLTASTGVISGTPTASADAVALTFKVTDSYSSAQSKSATLALTVEPASISVALSPGQAAVTVTQPLSMTPTTNDFAGVTWSSSPAGGTFSAAVTKNGAAVIFTAPGSAGAYTVTATSVTDPTRTSMTTLAVTDLEGVYTYHNDLSRDGVNAQEYALTPANVNTTSFGKLFSCAVDSPIYAQPLWVANLTINGAQHNVVFVATVGDSLYAFDADTSPCLQLWHVSLIDAAHGGVGVETVPVELGLWGTPVIDPASKTLYVAAKSTSPSGTVIERLHAINITSGSELTNSPVSISASYPTTSGTLAFVAGQHNNRAGLAFVNGVVYVAFGSNSDTVPWYGWMLGYQYSGGFLRQIAILNVAPNANGGGIWMSGGAPAADANGNLYVITGNGTFDANGTSAPNNDFGDTFLQLHPAAAGTTPTSALTISSWFAPTDYGTDDSNDFDFGSGGASVLINLPSTGGPTQHFLVGGGKDGYLYMVNGDMMGGLGDVNAAQKFGHQFPLFCTGAFFNNTFYTGPVGTGLTAFTFDSTTQQFDSNTAAQQTMAPSGGFGWPGTTPSISVPPGNNAAANANAIVWAIDNTAFCYGTPGGPKCKPAGPAVVHAYPAANLVDELWNSSMVSTDAAGNAMKFTVPTVANGKLYLGTRGNSTAFGTSSTIPGELDVYGLKP